MALSIEDTIGHYSLDTGDPAMLNLKENGGNQKNPSTNMLESKRLPHNTLLSEKEDLLNIHSFKVMDKTSKENCREHSDSIDFASSAPWVSNVSSKKVKFFVGAEENEDSTSEESTSKDASKELAATRKSHKKRVHFNTEVETFIFHPGFSITENYYFTEEPAVKNAFTSMNYERKSLNSKISNAFWKSESNLAIRNLKPCSQCGYMEEWSRYDHHIRQPKKELSPVFKYSRFDAEATDETPENKLKSWQKLKRTCSFVRKGKQEDEDGVSSSVRGNISRRLSKSMLSLRTDSKSLVDKVMSKVMTKKSGLHTIPELSEIDSKFTTNVSTKNELKRPHIMKRTKSFFFGMKQDEYDSAGLRSSTSTQALKRTDDIFMSDLSIIDGGDLPFVSNKEPKNAPRDRRTRNLDTKKNAKGEKCSPPAANSNFGLRRSKSVQNIMDMFDTKLLRNKFVTKLTKK